MADIISKERRSWNMSRIRSKDTKPELKVRSQLHNMGYRFRLHKKELPGNPDIILPKYMIVIFVNGCFWHRHEGCKMAYNPSSNIEFWQQKFRGNVERDRKAVSELNALGWTVHTVWECQTADEGELGHLLQNKLSPDQ